MIVVFVYLLCVLYIELMSFFLFYVGDDDVLTLLRENVEVNVVKDVCVEKFVWGNEKLLKIFGLKM